MVSKEHSLQDLDKILVGYQEGKSKGDLGVLLINVAKVIITMLVTIRSNQMLTDSDKAKIKEDRAKRIEQN